MRSYTLTLTTNGTVYNLNTLIKAINSKEGAYFGGISIQADSSNANPVLLGGANLSATVYGQRLAAGDFYSLDSGCSINAVSTLGIFALGVTTDSMKIHVALDER